jgi:hypothetical protein
MSDVVIPAIEPLVEPLLGLPYAQCHCWQLLRTLYGQGWGIDLDADPAAAAHQVQEIWFSGNATDPLSVMQCWDVLIMKTTGMASSHVGVVVNSMYLIHTRQSVGVCLEPLRRWAPRLMQIARLRRLL